MRDVRLRYGGLLESNLPLNCTVELVEFRFFRSFDYISVIL